MLWGIFLFVLVYEIYGMPFNGKDGVFLREVSYGKNVILQCRSNDENHIFEYWMFNNDVIIGPTNEHFNNVKFDYEILSGNLIIRAASKEEEGLYTCVSRAIKGNDRKIEKVKIVVAQDWEDIYEHDYNINLIRVLIILITLLLLGIGGYVIFRMWKERFRYPKYLEQENEDGTEELFSSASTSGINRSRSPGRIVLEKNVPSPTSDESNISTDFKSILEKSNE